MDHLPKVGDVIMFKDGRKSLVVGETDDGLLLAALNKPVEVSTHDLCTDTWVTMTLEDTWVTTTLEKALKGD